MIVSTALRKYFDGDPLIESNRVICQTQIAENKKAGEKAAEGYHLQERKPYWDKEFEGLSSSQPEHNRSTRKMPHCVGDLHLLQLIVIEDPVNEEVSIYQFLTSYEGICTTY